MREISTAAKAVGVVGFIFGVLIEYHYTYNIGGGVSILRTLVMIAGLPVAGVAIAYFLEKKNDESGKIQDDVVDRDLIANIDDHYELIRVKNRRLEEQDEYADE